VVGVLRDRASRGGSRCVHESLRVGMPITISEPRNHFALDEAATHSVLVAGGIGITPMLCMARRLKALGHSFEMLYFARERKSAAFLAELQALGMPLHLHFDAEAGGPPDLRALLAQRADAGPAPLFLRPDAHARCFREVLRRARPCQRHIERFTPVEVKASSDARSNYTVESRSGRFIEITPEKSCWTRCWTPVSMWTTAAAKASAAPARPACWKVCPTTATRCSAPGARGNKVMMVCVSGRKSERLVLDI
jgi:ferredoxin-NADP reductase